MSSQLLRTQGRSGTPEILVVSAAATLTPADQVVYIRTAGGAFALTLPPAAEATGVMLSLQKIDSSTNACTVQDQDETEGWSNIAMDAGEDMLVLLSNGRSWLILAQVNN